MIVGATDASDDVILNKASTFYKEAKLRRVYYSAFSPIPDSSKALPLIAPPLVREHRLYQADWLMRYYGFNATELTDASQPNLDLRVDPKVSWALRHRAFFPVDLNKAPREALLRIPGLGVKTVDCLLQARHWRAIRVPDLARLRVSLKKVLPFIQTTDHRPKMLESDRLARSFLQETTQLDLFSPPAQLGLSPEF